MNGRKIRRFSLFQPLLFDKLDLAFRLLILHSKFSISKSRQNPYSLKIKEL